MQNISWLILSLAIIAIIVFIKYNLNQKSDTKKLSFDVTNNNLPYIKKQFFFDKRENDFYTQLNSFLHTTYGDKYVIFSKVRLADLITVKDKDWRSRKLYNNKLMPRHIDFVICNTSYYNPVVAIELNGSSHTREDVQIRDAEKKAIFESANLALLIINRENMWKLADLLTPILK